MLKNARKIDSLQRKQRDFLKNVKDEWTPLGRQAPFLRTVFNGVSLPIRDKKTLVRSIGGNDRVIVAPSLQGYFTAVTVKDLIDNINPFLRTGVKFPVKSWGGISASDHKMGEGCGN